jgi:hypothetical protein
VKERPILFSGSMVRAILAGTKTQTRRAMRDQPWKLPHFNRGALSIRVRGTVYQAFNPQFPPVRCTYGQPGDRLWVREAFIHEPADYCWEASVSIPCRPAFTVYRADHEGDTRGAGWKPSIHMPRWASRITLEVTSVRVERLQGISADDAKAEGISEFIGGWWCEHDDAEQIAGMTPQEGYRHLWERINGPGSWDANPWVWVVSFRRIEP